jgi:hypothetical protein
VSDPRTKREIAIAVTSKMQTVKDYADGSVLATRTALDKVRSAQRDLEALAYSLERRLESIDRD